MRIKSAHLKINTKNHYFKKNKKIKKLNRNNGYNLVL